MHLNWKDSRHFSLGYIIVIGNCKMLEFVTNIKNWKSEFVGRIVTAIYHTKQDGPEEMFDGQVPVYYFDCVIEIDSKTKFAFGHDWISSWDKNEELYLVTHSNWEIDENLSFIGQKIKNIGVDEYNEMYFHLENDIIIYHNTSLGDQLFVTTYNDVFDDKGRFK